MKFSEFKYERIKLEEVAASYEDLMKQLSGQTTAEGFYEVFLKEQELEKKVETMATLASTRHSIDTRDEFYEKENDFWDETFPQLQAYSVRQNAGNLHLKFFSSMFFFSF